MRYQHLIQAVYHEPWLITAPAHAAIQRILESHLGTSALDVQAQREGTGPCGDRVEIEQMTIENGVARIPVGGVIGQRLSLMEKGSGAVDVVDIAGELAQAEEDPNVSAIVFDIDSPGGMVSGTPELADRISQASKPTYAYTSGCVASAAYWMASSCDAIYATRSAEVGSIGVYMAVLDQTKRYDQAGVKVELIKAGDLKGTGMPGLPLTKDQRDYLQSRVDDIYSMFTAHVAAQRGDIKAADMQGQTFLAEQAIERGLIDGIVSSYSDVEQIALTPHP